MNMSAARGMSPGAFADLWGTEELWCSVDSTHMNPPSLDGKASDLPGRSACSCLHVQY